MYRFFDDGRNNSLIVRETRLSPSSRSLLSVRNGCALPLPVPRVSDDQTKSLTRAKVLDDILVEIYSPARSSPFLRRRCGVRLVT